jgi:hypothetical protein
MSTDAASHSSGILTDEHGRDHVSPGEIAIGVIIGRTSEYFDFFVFGLGCVLVFPELVFPFADPLTATLYSFGHLRAGLCHPPDRLGAVHVRSTAATAGRPSSPIALFLLGGSTMAIAFLPGYATSASGGDLASSAGFRLLQGIALGGAWDGLSVPAQPQRARQPARLVCDAAAARGAARLHPCRRAVRLLRGRAVEAGFPVWGWRYPFFVALTINVVALFARLRMVATPEFAELMETRELVPVRSSSFSARMAACSSSAPSCRWRASRSSTSSPSSR